ncbi:unnamed protein product [Soboliphyme baturini]|uniref:Uncharacterized protein n=1 Tax=Soboliphyme baturini TaxID=241478 RepID=A0A183IGA7_9BILA|nr:unnamed protein product [Soboliphyme baturini]
MTEFYYGDKDGCFIRQAELSRFKRIDFYDNQWPLADVIIRLRLMNCKVNYSTDLQFANILIAYFSCFLSTQKFSFYSFTDLECARMISRRHHFIDLDLDLILDLGLDFDLNLDQHVGGVCSRSGGLLHTRMLSI